MPRVILGISGGVDSSVAGYLLKESGHEVIGVFMKNWEENDERGVCTAQTDYEDAKSVCLKLNIPFYSVNFAKEYWERVFSYFLEEYRACRTPNPDVLCNSEIKFKAFLDYAKATFDADYIATGHYVRTKAIDGSVQLLRGLDAGKDQSYFLSMLNKEQLSGALFPVGGLQKHEVREIAANLGLRTAEKKDSTGICFIGERNFAKFLSEYLPAQPGEIVDADTDRVIGAHDGLMYYTIGQRRGMGIGNLGGGERWYVASKDVEKNILYVAQGADNPRLFVNGFTCRNYSFVNPVPDKFACTLRYRYRQKEKNAFVSIDNGILTARFDEAQSGVAAGQIGVFYDDEICLGGGVIEQSFSDREI